MSTFMDWDKYCKMTPFTIDVPEPPCKSCNYWSPRVKTDKYGHFDGVVLCIAKERYPDFSCYRKEDEGYGV